MELRFLRFRILFIILLSAGWFGLNVSGQVAVACDGSSMNGTQLMNAMRSVPWGNILLTSLQRQAGFCW